MGRSGRPARDHPFPEPGRGRECRPLGSARRRSQVPQLQVESVRTRLDYPDGKLIVIGGGAVAGDLDMHEIRAWRGQIEPGEVIPVARYRIRPVDPDDGSGLIGRRYDPHRGRLHRHPKVVDVSRGLEPAGDRRAGRDRRCRGWRIAVVIRHRSRRTTAVGGRGPPPDRQAKPAWTRSSCSSRPRPGTAPAPYLPCARDKTQSPEQARLRRLFCFQPPARLAGRLVETRQTPSC